MSEDLNPILVRVHLWSFSRIEHAKDKEVYQGCGVGSKISESDSNSDLSKISDSDSMSSKE